jgi:hypothetical protein
MAGALGFGVGSCDKPSAVSETVALAQTAAKTPVTPADKIVARAKEEARRAVLYDASYVRLTYPGGDVPKERGACTEVVIRALRAAGYDLQRLMHEDMRRNFDRYPKRYGLSRPDRNIDHRRAANQIVFMKRFGKTLPMKTTGDARASWRPGDLVYWRLSNGMGHCGVLSDTRNAEGLPLVIHNLSRALEEDCLTAWTITGHFRYPAR